MAKPKKPANKEVVTKVKGPKTSTSPKANYKMSKEAKSLATMGACRGQSRKALLKAFAEAEQTETQARYDQARKKE